jgi:cytohesin
MKHLLLTTIAAVVLVGCGPKPPDISIHEAAAKGYIEAVNQHLDAGADLSAQMYGQTPLHHAAGGGNKEVVELLIAKGADVNAKGEDGETPLDLAIQHKPVLFIDGERQVSVEETKYTETADLLREHGGKTDAWLNADKSIHKAARAGHIEAVKQHLAAGADVNAKRYGATPLHKAAWGGHKEIAELLINNGADVNAKDKKGKTPVSKAALWGHKEVIELLIAAGADVNAKNDDGETPLDWVSSKVADLIRKHGGKTGEELKAEGK